MSELIVVDTATLKATPPVDNIIINNGLSELTSIVKCSNKRIYLKISFTVSLAGYTTTSGNLMANSIKCQTQGQKILLKSANVYISLPPIAPNTIPYVTVISIDNAGQDKVRSN